MEASADRPDLELAEHGILDEVRWGAFRAWRIAGTAAGVPVALLFFWKVGVQGDRPTGHAAAVLILLSIGLVWAVRRRTFGRAIGALVATMGAIPVVALFSVGPGFGVGAGLVTSVILAALFAGARSAIALSLAHLACLAVFAWVQGVEGAVGFAGFWHAPRWVYLTGVVSTAAYLALVVSISAAALVALDRAVAGLRGALAREAREREARLEAERLVVVANRLEAIGRLASGVVHDTRNALVGLGSGLRLLRQGGAAPAAPALLAEMERALEVASETMRQLVTLGGEGAAEPVEVEAGPLLERFSRALRLLLPAQVSVELGPLAPGRVRARQALLEQALLNLCLNARDAMPGGGRILLGLAARAGATSPELAFEVADEGPGVAPEVRDRLFEPFVTTKARGTGLGLAMVERFATEAGGRVEVESAPGRGARFRIVLPRA